MIAPRASSIGARLKFDFGPDGVILLDATKSPAEVSNEDGETDTLVRVSLKDFSAILAKELPGDLAFAMGKLRISGDMITGVRLTEILGR